MAELTFEQFLAETKESEKRREAKENVLIKKEFTAAFLEKKRKIVIKKIKVPKLEKNQVLVKIIYSGICGSQYFEYFGYRGKDIYLPHGLGHEASGIIVEKHKSLKKFKNTFGILFDDILAGFYVVLCLILFMVGKTYLLQ